MISLTCVGGKEGKGYSHIAPLLCMKFKGLQGSLSRLVDSPDFHSLLIQIHDFVPDTLYNA